MCCLLAAPPAHPEEKKGTPDSTAEPPLEKLVELNARELFGVEPELKDGKVILRLTSNGAFGRAFKATGSAGRGVVSSLEELKDPTLKGNVAAGIEGDFSFAGIDSGEALSRFELAGDLRITFRLRSNVIQPGASLLLRILQEDARNHVQTSFFQDIVVTENGKPRRKLTADARFTPHPSKWLLQKLAEPQATAVELLFQGKKLSVFVTLVPEKGKTERIEVVSQDGIEKPAAGRIFLKFSKLTFGLASLVIEGKYNKPWVETELARLRKEKKLRLRPGDPQPSLDNKQNPGKADQKAAKRGGAEAGKKGDVPPAKKPRRGKPDPTDLNKPDPDAEVEL